MNLRIFALQCESCGQHLALEMPLSLNGTVIGRFWTHGFQQACPNSGRVFRDSRLALDPVEEVAAYIHATPIGEDEA